MIHELVVKYTTSYSNLMGNSRILVAVLIALLFLYLNRSKLAFNPFVLILAPLGLISMGMAKVLELVKEKKNKWTMFGGIFLCGFALMLFGDRIYSPSHMTIAENSMHIPEGYKNAMDYVLEKSDSPRVLAMPDYSIYHSMYSSKFNMLYECRYDEDVRYLSEAARNAYGELSTRNPDMLKVSEAAVHYECDYIILKNDHYWPTFPLDYYDYQLETTVDGFDIYSRKEASD